MAPWRAVESLAHSDWGCRVVVLAHPSHRWRQAQPEQRRTRVFPSDDDALQMLHVRLDGLRIMSIKNHRYAVDEDASIWTFGGFTGVRIA